MAEAWLTKVGGFTVERYEIKRQGGKPYYPQPQTGIGVLHTTEGRSVQVALDTLAAKFSPSHFVTGENRIVQLRPLTAQASSLRNGMNAGAQVQIEMSAITQMDKRGVPISWMPDPATLNPTLALMAYFADSIPLVVPVDHWDDNGTDIVGSWAVNNTRRKEAAAKGYWPNRKGWWEHLEVPNQGGTWHWDCGMMRRTVMLKMAAELSPEPSAPTPPQPPVDHTVLDIQQALLRAGQKLPKFGADGNWGNESIAALVAFQRDAGLPRTGKRDAVTLEKLFNA